MYGSSSTIRGTYIKYTAMSASPSDTAIAPSVMLSSSWRDDKLERRISYLSYEGDGMDRAEALVQAALRSSPLADCITALPSAAAAPWLELQVGQSCGGVVALCLVANARVLEIHEVPPSPQISQQQQQKLREGSAPSPQDVTSADVGETRPLLTQEAQLADASTGLYAHFLCHGGGGALFPPQHGYRLKFFGRRPRDEICVPQVCLVVLPNVEVKALAPASSTASADASTAAATVHAPAMPAAEAAVAEVVMAMQRQLLMMERRLGAALDGVTQRISQLETRVSRLEAAPEGFAESSPGAAVLEKGSEINESQEEIEGRASE